VTEPDLRTRLQQANAFDVRVDRAFDVLRGHPKIDRTYYLASQLGDYSLIWHLIGTGRGLRSDRDADAAIRLGAVLLAESLLVNQGVKRLINRDRPVHEAIRPHRLRTPRTSSFPSGHASAAFTAAGILSDGDRLWPLYYAVAAVVATSRIHVRVHHATDVVAGAAVGLAFAGVAKRLWPLAEVRFSGADRSADRLAERETERELDGRAAPVGDLAPGRERAE